MLPYFALFVFTIFSGAVFCEYKKSKYRDWIFAGCIAVIMISMAALRAPSVGVDTEQYIWYFEQVQGKSLAYLFDKTNLYLKEPGYGLFNIIVAQFTQSPVVLLGITSALIISLRCVFICRYSSLVWVSICIYICFGFFGYSMCTLRQELAISIVMFAIPYLSRRQWLVYFPLVIFAALFHASVWFLLPLYWIANIPLNKWILSFYCIGALATLFFSEALLGFVTKYVYKIYQPGSYYTLERDYNTALFPVALMILAILLYKKLVSLKRTNIVLVNYCCYAGLLFILTVKNFIFQRIALLFFPAILLLIPEMIRCAAPDPNLLLKLEESSLQKKKKQSGIGELKKEIKSQKMLYYTVLGSFLAAGAIYYSFLLNTNRLSLVPYLIR